MKIAEVHSLKCELEQMLTSSDILIEEMNYNIPEPATTESQSIDNEFGAKVSAIMNKEVVYLYK